MATTVYGDIWGFDNYAVLGTRLGDGVYIIDVTDPTSPSVTSQYLPSDGSAPQDVKVQNGIGYFAMNGGGGVDIVDLSDPSQPTFLSNVGNRGVHNVFVSGDFLFTTSGGSRSIQAYDVSNPTEPELLYDIPTAGRTHDMTIVGSRLYVSNIGNATTQIFDISQMSAETMPQLISTFDSGPSTHSNWVTEDGNILVSAAERSQGDIRIFDISDPAEPELLSSFISRDFLTEGIRRNHVPHNPVIVDDKLYVSWYDIGLQVFDIADPANPVHLGRYDTQNNWGVYPFFGSDTILISDIDHGLKILDVTSLLDGSKGDFNGDGLWDCQDVDQLSVAIADESTDRNLDMNGDGMLHRSDIPHWFTTAESKNLVDGETYLMGDANLDGVVDGADFGIWNDHKFSVNGAYCSGDFNTDGIVDGNDFLVWNAGRNAVGQSRFGTNSLGVTAVPEPAFCLGWLVFLCVFLRRK